MAVVLVMLVLATMRWFMHHDTEVGREVGTWAITLLLVPALTVLALYLLGGIQGNAFWHELRGLLSIG
jgi:uncharacterized protein (DUF983 family)